MRACEGKSSAQRLKRSKRRLKDRLCFRLAFRESTKQSCFLVEKGKARKLENGCRSADKTAEVRSDLEIRLGPDHSGL